VKENSAQGTSLMPRAGRKRRGKLREGCRVLQPPAPAFRHHSDVRCFLPRRNLSDRSLAPLGMTTALLADSFSPRLWFSIRCLPARCAFCAFSSLGGRLLLAA